MPTSPPADVRPVDAAALRRWPLPPLDDSGDKNSRGRVLVVGGAPVLPGGVRLAAEAALRAGAGRLCIATTRSIAVQIGVAVPEARVMGAPETRAGGVSSRGAAAIAEVAARSDAILIGPGMMDEPAITRLLTRVLPACREGIVVLDAGAIGAVRGVRDLVAGLEGRVVFTPHAGEMAGWLGVERAEVEADPAAQAAAAAGEWNAVVALKGPTTRIATPAGVLHEYAGGGVGLATSGSGDTLAGIVAGLAARGATSDQAAAWGVFAHGESGQRLAERVGPVGFLARELLAEIPRVLSDVSR